MAAQLLQHLCLTNELLIRNCGDAVERDGEGASRVRRGGANGVHRKSPDYRELSYLRSIQGWADPFHAQSARSARAGTRFSKVNVAASLHCSLTPKRPRVALPGPGSSVAVGRSQPPPALPAATLLQRPYAAHRCIYARRQSHPLLAPCAKVCESTMSAPRHGSAGGAEATSAAQRAAARRT